MASNLNFNQGFDQKNNLGLVLSLVLKFYSSLAKGLKLKVKKFGGLITAFGEDAGGNGRRGDLWPTSHL